jgi:hypothetical protein
MNRTLRELTPQTDKVTVRLLYPAEIAYLEATGVKHTYSCKINDYVLTQDVDGKDFSTRVGYITEDHIKESGIVVIETRKDKITQMIHTKHLIKKENK